MIKVYLLPLLLLCSSLAFGQTKGFIFKPASTAAGKAVLDPNGDGYTSATSDGFKTNDWGMGESEIKYQPIPVLEPEPSQDLQGPGCGFTDLVDSGQGDPVNFYFDNKVAGSENFLVRFRLNKTSPNSKGYSVLIDADKKFGFTGANADPNAVTGNPGFEFELVLMTNVSVALYYVDGSVTPQLIRSFPYEAYSQKSVAFTEQCGDADYFYDFYMPFSTFSSHSYPIKIYRDTPIRMAALSVMNPQAAIGNNAKSDVGGVNDVRYSGNYDLMFEDLINNYNPTSPEDMNNGLKTRSVCPAINAPILVSATSISGTSTETGAIITVFKNGVALSSTTTVSSTGSWSLAVTGLAEGDIITASAKAAGKEESERNCSEVLVAQNCTRPATPALTGSNGNSNKYVTITAATSGFLHLYLGDQLLLANVAVTAGVTYYYCPTAGLATSTNSCSGGNNLAAGVYRATLTVAGCTSNSAFLCVNTTTASAVPVVTSPITTLSRTITGKAVAGASVILKINGTERITVKADESGNWSVPASSFVLAAGDKITAYAIENGKCQSAESVAVTVIMPTSLAPTITGAYCGTTNTVTGFAAEGAGTTIKLFVGTSSTAAATGTTDAKGFWQISGLSLAPGTQIRASATATGKLESGYSATVTIQATSPNTGFTINGTTDPQTAEKYLIENVSSLSGDGPSGSGTVKLYADGIYIGSGSLAGGVWSVSKADNPNTFYLYAGAALSLTYTAAGSCESAPAPLAISIRCVPPANKALDPKSLVLCSGAQPQLTVKASEPLIVYQLYRGTTAISSSVLGTGGDIVLKVNTPLTTATATRFDLTIRASRFAYADGAQCYTTLAEPLAIVLNPVIGDNSLAAPAAGATYCGTTQVDQLTGSQPTGGDGTYTYQWQLSTNNTDWTTIDGATGQHYTPGAVAATTYFRRTVLSGSCTDVNTAAVVKITINPVLNNVLTAGGATTFKGSGDPAAITGTTNAGYTYQWQQSLNGTSFTSIEGATLANYDPPRITASTWYRRQVFTSSCTSVSDPIAYTITADAAPVASNTTVHLDENAANGTAVHTVAASDPDNDPLSFRMLSGNESGAFSIDATTGAIVVADASKLDFETTPQFILKVAVADAHNTIETTITIELNNLNDNAPVAQNATVSIYENVAAGTAVHAVVATDADGSSLTYSITGGNGTGAGAFAIEPATGAITVADRLQMNFEATPSYTLTIRVSDGAQAATATVTVNLLDVDEAVLTANDAIVAIAENAANGTAVHTVVASDPENDPLTYTIASGNAAGAFAIAEGTGAITVADGSKLDYESATKTYTLSVEVRDNQGSLATAQITINVQDVNEAPVAQNATVSLAENSANATLVHTLVATDPDAGDVLSFSIQSGNTNEAFAINGATGAVTVADGSQLNFESMATYTLVIRITDKAGVFTDVQLVVNLTNVNEAPVAQNATVEIGENAATGSPVHTVAASDPDAGAVLSYSILSGNAAGAFALDAATGAITVADGSKLDFESTPSYTLMIEVADNEGLKSQAQITISVLNVNEAPTAENATVEISENLADATLVHKVVATDPDAAEVLTYAIVAGNSLGAFEIDPASGELRVANSSKLDFETTPGFSLSVEVSDRQGLTATAVITINLRDVNEAPAAQNATVSLPENSANATPVHSVQATDQDKDDSMQFAITAGNEAGAFSIDPATGAITVADASKLDYETIQRFVLAVEITDSKGAITTVSITVNLQDVNELPLLSGAGIELNEDDVYTGASLLAGVTDPEGSSLSINTTPVTAPAHGTLVINADGTYTYTPAANYWGTDRFTYQVCDSGTPSQCSTATISITIHSVNDAPVAAVLEVEVTEETSLSQELMPQVSDVDGDELTISTTALTAPAHGMLVIHANGSFTYTPNAGYTGADSFTYQVCDNQSPAACAEGTVTIQVVPAAGGGGPGSGDSDGDGMPDSVEWGPDMSTPRDSDGDGTPDYLDLDSDNDGVPDSIEAGLDPNNPRDTDGDGLQNFRDPDDDNDGLPTLAEIAKGGIEGDCDYDGIYNYLDADICGLEISLGFSPNGDLDNDFWLIKGIGDYPTNKVKIFNRWGNQVFETTGYNNEDKVWRGESEGKYIPGKNQVPDGTYFYFLDLGDGSKPLSGFIVIKR